MLQIKNIRKEYITGDLRQVALDDVSLNLRDNEFVAILGPSGSGKTTLLNIIGGLDRYDSGDLIINGISTKKYRDRDWDSYRNHTIGFVFQSYNLIPHQSILANVELALTISGISRSERRRRAQKALEEVGLGDQLHKRPNQMSGGQMQRVAIARALVNDPDILLADEPTGALDTETSVQVMELLKQVARDRLVVMVTHNPELAENYATRIVKLRDGRITDDSDPYEAPSGEQTAPVHKNMGRSSMSLLTSLALSFNNLRTKKARTVLTSFAGSIGIIGIALILSLSNGVNLYISSIQKSTMVSYPITIEKESFDLSSLISNSRSKGMNDREIDHELDGVYTDTSRLEMASELISSFTTNNLTEFKKYLDDPDSEIQKYLGENGVVYSYDTKFSVYTYDPDGVFLNTDGSTLEGGDQSYGMMSGMSMGYTMERLSGNFEELLPGQDGGYFSAALGENYEIVEGRWPEAYNEVVIRLDQNNEIASTVLYQLGMLPSAEYNDIIKRIREGESPEIKSYRISYEDVLAKEFYMIPACDTYIDNGDGTFTCAAGNLDEIEKLCESAVKLSVVGIIRPTDDDVSFVSNAVAYTKALTDYVIKVTGDSAVVKAQKESPDINVLNAMTFAPDSDEQRIADTKTYLSSLGVTDKAEIMKTVIQLKLASGAGSVSGAGKTSAADAQAVADGGSDGAGGQQGFAGGGATVGDTSQMSGTAQMGGTTQMTGTAQMSGEAQMAAMLDSYLTDPDDDVLLAIYDKYISSGTYDGNMSDFGVINLDAPSAISIYADSFSDKDSIAGCIEAYNKTATEENRITYTDYVGLLMSSITTIINVISYVLIAFVAVSLVVSSIMIGIITYISVLERTKEIGILRAIGASKRNISQVFNAETFIIGLIAGLMGIGITLLLLIPGNAVIHSLTESPEINAALPIPGAAVLILLSVVLTLIGGIIPSKKAAKKDPVTALRSE